MQYKTLKEVSHLNGHQIFLIELLDCRMYMLLHIFNDEIKESRCYSYIAEKSKKEILQLARKDFANWKQNSFYREELFGEPA